MIEAAIKASFLEAYRADSVYNLQQLLPILLPGAIWSLYFTNQAEAFIN